MKGTQWQNVTCHQKDYNNLWNECQILATQEGSKWNLDLGQTEVHYQLLELNPTILFQEGLPLGWK